jgi:hypothetical protein
MPKLLSTLKESAEVTAGRELSPDVWANEYVFEVRYAPNPRMLDHRGKWAEQLSSQLALPEWQIDTNRLDVFSTDQKTRAFVGFRSTGLVLMDNPSRGYFETQSDKLLRWLFRQTEFGSNLMVERIGVRLRFGVRFSRTFEELRDRITTRYFQLPEHMRIAVGEDAVLLDIAAVLNWKDALGAFNTTLGPMTGKELSNQFKRGEENPPPDVGLYYDIDYFKKPESVLMGVEIIRAVKNFASGASDRYQRIRDLIFGEISP